MPGLELPEKLDSVPRDYWTTPVESVVYSNADDVIAHSVAGPERYPINIERIDRPCAQIDEKILALHRPKYLQGCPNGCTGEGAGVGTATPLRQNRSCDCSHNSKRPHLASLDVERNHSGFRRPSRPRPRAAKPAVDLSSSRSQVFDHQIRRSGGTDHGFKKVDSGRAELVVSRITTTISIARQGPSAFFISVGGPALRRTSSRLVQIFRQDTFCNSEFTAKQWLAFRGELQ